MSGLAVLLGCVAALVWVGQWISVRALAAGGPVPGLPPRLHARLQWWTGHRPVVSLGCAVLVAVALGTGLLAR